MEEAQVLKQVLQLDGMMEVGVLEVDRGCTGGERQRLNNRPERLHAKFLWADEAVEGKQLDNGLTSDK